MPARRNDACRKDERKRVRVTRGHPTARPVVLTFVRHYLPGFKAGGPIRTIANLVEALGDELEFRIVTSDRDATDRAPFPDIAPDGAWQGVGKARVLYLSPREKALRNVARILNATPHDTLYLNSFFDPVFTLKPLLARRLGLVRKSPCVIAPRGEFSRGALALKHHKKAGYLTAARITGLYRDLKWQASNPHEKTDIARVLGAVAQDVRVAPNLPGRGDDLAPEPFAPRAEGEPLRVCFLSRISPMKNLDFALRALQDVKVPVRFDIHGPIRDQVYWSRCQRLFAHLPDNVRASYKGSVEQADVHSAMQRYDLFFLPTRGENFGHVILDALRAGTPVLIADTTPWHDLEAFGVGWSLSLRDAEMFARTIESFAAMTGEERTAMRFRALAYAAEHICNDRAISANADLFVRALP